MFSGVCFMASTTVLLNAFFPLGDPKGAMLTHRNIVSNMSAFVKATEVKLADKSFKVLVPKKEAFTFQNNRTLWNFRNMV